MPIRAYAGTYEAPEFPQGLALDGDTLYVADGKVYVADTNNHAVRVLCLASGEAATLELNWSGV